MKACKKVLTALLLAITMAACVSTAPLTGRRQIKLVSDQSLVAQSTQSYHQLISKEKQEGKIINNSYNGRRLQKIGKRISTAVEQFLRANGMGDKVSSLQWEFNLINSKEVNAFAMPGGKIVFYEGIFPILQSDAGIAFVMGHEIGHVIGGHHAEGYSQKQVAGWTSAIAGELIGSPEMSSLVNKGIGLGLLKFNRTQEYEADKYGMIFMAIAGYSPEEAIHVQERMARASKQQGSDFFSTHPSGYNRIRALQNYLPEAMKYYKK